MSLEWLAGLAFAAVCGLAGIIYATIRARQDRQDTRLEHHVDEDIKVHERVSVIESKVQSMEREQSSMRLRLHDMANDVTKMLGRIFKDES